MAASKEHSFDRVEELFKNCRIEELRVFYSDLKTNLGSVLN